MSTVRPTLLIVDDEPGMRSLVEAFARREGVDVVAAGDGSQAMGWLRPAWPN